MNSEMRERFKAAYYLALNMGFNETAEALARIVDAEEANPIRSIELGNQYGHLNNSEMASPYFSIAEYQPGSLEIKRQ